MIVLRHVLRMFYMFYGNQGGKRRDVLHHVEHYVEQNVEHCLLDFKYKYTLKIYCKIFIYYCMFYMFTPYRGGERAEKPGQGSRARDMIQYPGVSSDSAFRFLSRFFAQGDLAFAVRVYGTSAIFFPVFAAGVCRRFLSSVVSALFLSAAWTDFSGLEIDFREFHLHFSFCGVV